MRNGAPTAHMACVHKHLGASQYAAPVTDRAAHMQLLISSCSVPCILQTGAIAGVYPRLDISEVSAMADTNKYKVRHGTTECF